MPGMGPKQALWPLLALEPDKTSRPVVRIDLTLLNGETVRLFGETREQSGPFLRFFCQRSRRIDAHDLHSSSLGEAVKQRKQAASIGLNWRQIRTTCQRGGNLESPLDRKLSRDHDFLFCGMRMSTTVKTCRHCRHRREAKYEFVNRTVECRL